MVLLKDFHVNINVAVDQGQKLIDVYFTLPTVRGETKLKYKSNIERSKFFLNLDSSFKC